MNDQIKTYEGHLIMPFGRPTIITTAWETSTHYHTQSVRILDCLDGTIDLSLHYQPFSKNAPSWYLPGSLTKAKALKYVLDYGYDMAFRSIPTALWNYGYSKQDKSINWPNPNTVEIKLTETKNMELVILTYLLRKDKKLFSWLEEHAQAGILKALIKTTKGLDIQSSQSYNK